MNTITSLNADIGLEKHEISNSHTLWRVASICAAAALGGAGASVESLRSTASGLSFQVSLGTVVGFIIGTAIGLLYWHIAANSAVAARRGSWVLAIAGVGLFLYPLRFVPAEKLPEIAIGLSTAAVALSIAGILISRVGRFLDGDERETELAQKR
jgi:hypothetical protein